MDRSIDKPCVDLAAKKPKLDSVLRGMRDRGFKPNLTEQSYIDIMGAGLRSKSLPIAFVATQLALEEHPVTLRGLMYRVVSAGFLPSTDKAHYNRLGRIVTSLRECGILPFQWIVDNVRATDKPSSWSGLADYADTVKNVYRLDYWERLPDYVHFVVEKDAIAGVLAPVTRKYDVALSPIRGYVSLSFAHEIADVWNQVSKPIFCFYLGDYDASGFDLERDVRAKLARYCERPFHWTRLGVNPEDFATFNLIPLEAKKSDSRYKKFIAYHGSQCAELDAIPAVELRRRVKGAIDAHIDQTTWAKLRETEALEKETLTTLARNWRAA